MKKQRQFVERYLLENEYISRNFCNQQFLFRLASIVNKLNDNGWTIKGKEVKNKRGKDYVYTLLDSPYERFVYQAEGHEPIIKWEKKLSTSRING